MGLVLVEKAHCRSYSTTHNSCWQSTRQVVSHKRNLPRAHYACLLSFSTASLCLSAVPGVMFCSLLNKFHRIAKDNWRSAEKTKHQTEFYCASSPYPSLPVSPYSIYPPTSLSLSVAVGCPRSLTFCNSLLPAFCFSSPSLATKHRESRYANALLSEHPEMPASFSRCPVPSICLFPWQR